MDRKIKTDSFGKHIKTYTVKLAPVSHRKNTKISYAVENQPHGASTEKRPPDTFIFGKRNN